MTKRIVSVAVAIAFATLCANAQNDTTIVRNANNVVWDKVTYTSDKAGVKPKQEYIVSIDGKTYHTNKTSHDRAKTCERFAVAPVIAKITNKSNPEGRIVVL